MPESHATAGKAERQEPATAAPGSIPAHQQDLGKIRAHYVWLTLLAAMLTGALVWALTAYFCERLHQEARVRVAALAATIAAGIPGEGVQALADRGDEKSSAYLEIRSLLIAARQANPDLRRVFALLPGKTPRKWRFAMATSWKVVSLWPAYGLQGGKEE